MKLLLDTHTALWWWAGSAELSDTVIASLTDPANTVYFSAISGYEIMQKVRFGKLHLPGPLLQDLPGQVRRESWQVLPLGLEETVRAAQLDSPHRDPFDRLLAAQAGTHDLSIVTTDRFFAQAGCRTLW